MIQDIFNQAIASLDLTDKEKLIAYDLLIRGELGTPAIVPIEKVHDDKKAVLSFVEKAPYLEIRKIEIRGETMPVEPALKMVDSISNNSNVFTSNINPKFIEFLSYLNRLLP